MQKVVLHKRLVQLENLVVIHRRRLESDVRGGCAGCGRLDSELKLDSARELQALREQRGDAHNLLPAIGYVPGPA